ncbi:MAG: hypothetical protein ACTXOO_00770 [Sodalis sp. (in: enterobacteria)]
MVLICNPRRLVEIGSLNLGEHDLAWLIARSRRLLKAKKQMWLRLLPSGTLPAKVR